MPALGFPAGALAAAAALLLSRPAPPLPPRRAPAALVHPSPAAAVAAVLGDATGVVAFGEVHQDQATAAVRSALARFTDEILPALAPRASHLIVETWVTRGSCGEVEAQVTADVARTTERPAATESELVRLLRRAKELGVAPHILDVSCDEYRSLTGTAGAVDYDRLLSLTGRHLQAAVAQAVRLPRPAARPLVLVYGGALHNDLYPAPGLAAYSFGPAVHALMRGDYREVDLYVPELVDRLAAWRAEAWYPVWQRQARRAAPQAVTTVARSARSAMVIFPRTAPGPAAPLPAAAKVDN